MGASEAVPHLGLRNRSKLGFAHACACVEPLSWAQNALKNHVGEAHSTSASMKGACESAPVGVMLGNVALLLHFYLTAKMEDFIAKLKQFSKLDFQSKREMINNGRPMPELKGMLQATGKKITRSTFHIQSQIPLNMFGTSRIHLVLNLQRQLRWFPIISLGIVLCLCEAI